MLYYLVNIIKRRGNISANHTCPKYGYNQFAENNCQSKIKSSIVLGNEKVMDMDDSIADYDGKGVILTILDQPYKKNRKKID